MSGLKAKEILLKYYTEDSDLFRLLWRHSNQVAEKAAKKIVRGIAKRKKRMVMGVDGRSMWFFSRLFPRLTPRIITKVLKISGLDMFSEVFGEETENTAGK